MALLTADEVLNKKFQATKFREGYDQDEVDDFLDEVVNTLRDLQGENDDLKTKLAAAERRKNNPGEDRNDTHLTPNRVAYWPKKPASTSDSTSP